MRPEVHRRTLQLIGRFNLHATVPVQLWKLEDIFPVRYEDMDGLLGVIFPPLEGWPATTRNRARILVNNQLGLHDARLVIAHEIGHALCHHVGQSRSYNLGLDDRHEQESWEVAARLLIPQRVVMEEREIQRVAGACAVPTWLAELWQY